MVFASADGLPSVYSRRTAKCSKSLKSAAFLARFAAVKASSKAFTMSMSANSAGAVRPRSYSASSAVTVSHFSRILLATPFHSSRWALICSKDALSSNFLAALSRSNEIDRAAFTQSSQRRYTAPRADARPDLSRSSARADSCPPARQCRSIHPQPCAEMPHRAVPPTLPARAEHSRAACPCRACTTPHARPQGTPADRDAPEFSRRCRE